MAQTIHPVQIDPLSPIEFFIAWNNGEKFSMPYVEFRFACPCAGCVDEKTGERVIQKNTIPADIRATGVQLVGRYAIQITWSNGHDTGIYHFDRIYDLCKKFGKRL